MSNIEYKLLKEDGKCSKFKTLVKRLTYQIPDQDAISKKKDRIAKWELIATVVCLTSLLVALWWYNAHHPLVELEYKAISELALPIMTVCLPTMAPIADSQHYLSFREFNLSSVTRPGQFSVRENVDQLCSSYYFGDSERNDSCASFIEYDGSCLHIGLNSNLPWRLKTEGKTILSLILVYRSPLELTRNLIMPFFAWNSTCHGEGDDDDRSKRDECTLKDDQFLSVQSLQRDSPFVLYQLATNQMLLADVTEEHHVTSHGIKSTLYPTNFVGFPFDVRAEFGSLCSKVRGEFNEPCRVIYLGLRSLSRVVKYTREESYLSRAIRSIATASSQLSLITGVAAILFGYVITRLTINQPTGYIDHDLREAVLYLLAQDTINKQASLL